MVAVNIGVRSGSPGGFLLIIVILLFETQNQISREEDGAGTHLLDLLQERGEDFVVEPRHVLARTATVAQNHHTNIIIRPHRPGGKREKTNAKKTKMRCQTCFHVFTGAGEGNRTLVLRTPPAALGGHRGNCMPLFALVKKTVSLLLAPSQPDYQLTALPQRPHAPPAADPQ